MDAINISVVDTAGGDLSVVNSARVSFNKWVDGEITDNDTKLINYLASHKHMTPFRHNFIQLRCKAPIFLARQLGKHQAGLTWNEVSRRYVSDSPEFYFPAEWRGKPEGSIKQGSGSVVTQKHPKDLYQRMVRDCLQDYHKLLSHGVAPEMARMVLPQSMLTEWIWSGNLLAFVHMYKERTAETAQLEAQIFAQKLHEVIQPLFPISWEALTNS